MFEEGYIIYFDPFYFKNGNPAKPKYGLVLKKIEEKTVILSLPTRNDCIPSTYQLIQEMECIELPDINQNCFFLSTIKEVTECGKKFDFNTFLYGHQLDIYNNLEDIYPEEGLGVQFSIWGKVKQDIFEQIVHCFKNSKSVKRKYKSIL